MPRSTGPDPPTQRHGPGLRPRSGSGSIGLDPASDSVTSRRKRKKAAQAQGLTERELDLLEVVEELLDQFRWLQVLAYANQYHVNRHLKVDEAERDRIFEAAVRAVEKDARLERWQERLGRVKGEVLRVKRSMARARKDMDRGLDPADPGRLDLPERDAERGEDA